MNDQSTASKVTPVDAMPAMLAAWRRFCRGEPDEPRPGGFKAADGPPGGCGRDLEALRDRR
jgi:hypothetical protein